MSRFLGNNELYDEHAVYNEFCPPLEEIDASTPMPFDLYTKSGAAAVVAQGSTKSHYSPDPQGIPLYDSGERSDHRVSVQRIAWVDGWRETVTINGEEEQKDPMTLVVLKFSFKSFSADLQIKTMRATLTFKDCNQTRGDDPEVQAWAPFYKLERSKHSAADVTSSSKRNMTASGGYSGSSLSIGWDKEFTVSWNQTAFDEGVSEMEYNKKGRPFGVTWFMKQNKLQNHGITPEVWATVLLKRNSAHDPYFVTFRIDVQTGTFDDLKHNVKRLLGLRQGDSSSFTVTPRPGMWDQSNHHAEGEKIRKNKDIDLKNLGNLIGGDKADFNNAWSPPVANNIATNQESSLPRTTIGDEAETYKVERSEVASAQPLLSQPPAPPLPYKPLDSTSHLGGFITHEEQPQPAWRVDGFSVEHDSRRLTALEARAAQTEARLATQDIIIAQLRRDIERRDAQLVKVEQALRAVGTTFCQLQSQTNIIS
ncbi:hypothetical protein TGAM01_v200192 [Trichoderma gamsii]|uniref:Uncharacterized protein n=1 Tax=Trichoderma gamsii TaxID=398673 RepID=A0A2P5A2L0_9HYPO|nr:hypothetical protein TGAM01_v200192 [Trichoderma gamsii]PON30772.1 hypothetical protein TGAM01_v200192 [Trichoderma gamsii]